MVARSPNSRTNLFKAIFQFCIDIVHFRLACSMARYTTFLAESSVGNTIRRLVAARITQFKDSTMLVV